MALVCFFEISASMNSSLTHTAIVIPAWSAGIEADMDVSEGILRNWMPAIHAGMTEICVFLF